MRTGPRSTYNANGVWAFSIVRRTVEIQLTKQYQMRLVGDATKLMLQQKQTCQRSRAERILLAGGEIGFLRVVGTEVVYLLRHQF